MKIEYVRPAIRTIAVSNYAPIATSYLSIEDGGSNFGEDFPVAE